MRSDCKGAEEEGHGVDRAMSWLVLMFSLCDLQSMTQGDGIFLVLYTCSHGTNYVIKEG